MGSCSQQLAPAEDIYMTVTIPTKRTRGMKETSQEEAPPPILSEAHSFSGLASGEDRAENTTSRCL